jgi:hypothetical protein
VRSQKKEKVKKTLFSLFFVLFFFFFFFFFLGGNCKREEGAHHTYRARQVRREAKRDEIGKIKQRRRVGTRRTLWSQRESYPRWKRELGGTPTKKAVENGGVCYFLVLKAGTCRGGGEDAEPVEDALWRCKSIRSR